MKKIFVLCLTTSLSLAAHAQDGSLSGAIVDSETGEGLIGANIYIPEIQTGVTTDLSGNYHLKLEPGAYTVEYSYVSYQKKIVSDVPIKTGEVTRLDIAMAPKNEELREVVVSANRLDNNEISLLRLQKKSLSIQDGISAEEMNRVGFGNSAESMKQVTGASVEGGKFIVMRGLGDRYSISSLDGVVLPSANPYRNSAGLDLIPTSMVENIVVKKTFTPDLPGNFTGGAVDISAKSLPDQFYFTFSASLGYNDQASFSGNFRRDKIRGKTDWLGYDDGSRSIPSVLRDNKIMKNGALYTQIIMQDPENNKELIGEYNQSMQAFSGRPYSLEYAKPGLNRSFRINTGNRLNLGQGKLGYNLGLTFEQDFEHFNQREITNYTARISNENRMQIFQRNRGTESVENSTHGIIASLAYQLPRSAEFQLTYIYNNSGSSQALDMSGVYPGAISGAHTFENRAISFMQRNLSNVQLKGKHTIGKWTVTWSGNHITSKQYEPDVRFLGTDIRNGTYGFDNAEYPLPFHFFRDLKDTQYNGKLDLEILVGERNKLHAGGLFTKKVRLFNENRYQLSIQTMDYDFYTSPAEANGDFDVFFSEDNAGILQVNDGSAYFGNTYTDQTAPYSAYAGFEQVIAAYAMGIFRFGDQFTVTVGARAEKTDFEVQSAAKGEEPGTIDNLDILPAANLIYSLNETSALRASFSRTLARPNMREMAPFASFDLLGGFPIKGNPDLKQTDISNADLRYEVFPRPGELIALSLFYKNFENPIVAELDAASDQPQYQYVNTPEAFLSGVEFEFRKNLDFISPSLANFKFGANFSYIYSRVDLSQEEYSIRRQIDPAIKDWRPFAAQSPYLVNLLLAYASPESGWEAAVYANAFGPRLFANGAGAAPDVYEIYGRINDSEGNNRITRATPIPDMSVKIKKEFGRLISASLSVDNILDYSVVRYQKHKGVYYTNESFNPGRTYAVSLTYSVR